MKNLLKSLLACCLLTTVPACETALNSGHVVSVTETVLGFKIAQAVANETPEVDFGYSRSTVVLEPTITNQTINVPGIANTFGFNNTSFLDFGLDETFASQSYQTGNNTNDISSQPIIPK